MSEQEKGEEAYLERFGRKARRQRKERKNYLMEAIKFTTLCGFPIVITIVTWTVTIFTRYYWFAIAGQTIAGASFFLTYFFWLIKEFFSSPKDSLSYNSSRQRSTNQAPILSQTKKSLPPRSIQLTELQKDTRCMVSHLEIHLEMDELVACPYCERSFYLLEKLRRNPIVEFLFNI